MAQQNSSLVDIKVDYSRPINLEDTSADLQLQEKKKKIKSQSQIISRLFKSITNPFTETFVKKLAKEAAHIQANAIKNPYNQNLQDKLNDLQKNLQAIHQKYSSPKKSRNTSIKSFAKPRMNTTTTHCRNSSFGNFQNYLHTPSSFLTNTDSQKSINSIIKPEIQYSSQNLGPSKIFKKNKHFNDLINQSFDNSLPKSKNNNAMSREDWKKKISGLLNKHPKEIKDEKESSRNLENMKTNSTIQKSSSSIENYKDQLKEYSPVKLIKKPTQLYNYQQRFKEKKKEDANNYEFKLPLIKK